MALLEDQLELNLVFNWTSPHAEKRNLGFELARLGNRPAMNCGETHTPACIEGSLRAEAELVTWRPLAKDGAALPPERSLDKSAAQVIAVGETYDFEYEAPPQGHRPLWLEVRSPGGKWHAQCQIIVK